ncbi:hypothetical protein BPT24_044 [Tenacibaculum phage pT24]|uniref:Lipoprotein n=1 Tax=Tenacibaculum phage pT24 TaxID=1880590 RepID=A0A1B4XWK2_9CAUD|nr:hypothetical protein HYP10_gp044 [Tenacibaculum phage pT24]BAV39167.1 hypothetical protein BPT24_044 [Tenacibaculum phage pT24]
MKKIIYLLVAVLTIGFTSCSSHDELPNDGIQTTKVVSIFNQQSSAKSSEETKASKDVKRNGIYDWVKDVTINFDNTGLNHTAQETFTLVPNSTTGALDNFEMDDVAIGSNEITAWTTTSAIGYNNLTKFNGNINSYKSVLPYVLYEATPQTKEIVQGTNVVNLDMRTQHGRRLSVLRYKSGSWVKNNTLCIVDVLQDGVVVDTKELKKNESLISYWSDETALVGNTITLRFNIYSKSTGQIIKVYNKVLEITASTSITCVYEVTDTGLFEDIQGITLNFQDWIETYCPDCPTDLGGN